MPDDGQAAATIRLGLLRRRLAAEGVSEDRRSGRRRWSRPDPALLLERCGDEYDAYRASVSTSRQECCGANPSRSRALSIA